MFHRVKSENEPAQSTQAKTQPQERTQTPLTEKAIKPTQTPAAPIKSAPAKPETKLQTQERMYSATPANYEARGVSRYSVTPANVTTKTQSKPTNPYQTKQTATPQEKKDTPKMTTAKNNTQDTSARKAPYGGGYPGAKSYNAAKPAPKTQTGDNRVLTIGQGITMSGEIEYCDYLLVEGTVEAALKGAANLEIAESGTFYGTVEIEEATIAGRFEGDITVGKLIVSSTGSITGSITYAELELEAGATIDGRLTPVSATQRAAQPAPQAEETVQDDAQEIATDRTPANSDGELFSAAETAAE